MPKLELKLYAFAILSIYTDSMRWWVVFLCHCVEWLHVIKQQRLKLSGLFLTDFNWNNWMQRREGTSEERECSHVTYNSRTKPTSTTNPQQPNRKQFLILQMLDNILPIYSSVCLLVRGCCRAGRHGSLRYSDAVFGHVCNLSLQISGEKALTEAMPALERWAGRTSVQLSTLKWFCCTHHSPSLCPSPLTICYKQRRSCRMALPIAHTPTCRSSFIYVLPAFFFDSTVSSCLMYLMFMNTRVFFFGGFTVFLFLHQGNRCVCEMCH